MSALDIIKSALPWIGTALGGPLGGAAASFVGQKLGLPALTVDAVKSVLGGMSPEKLAELKNIDNEFQLKMAKLNYDSVFQLEQLNINADIQNSEAVNKTIQAEVSAEHWPSYSWRPFIGFMFGLYIASLFMLPLFGVTPVRLENEMILAVGGILGVASWFRGKAQANPEIQNTPTITQKG